MKVKHSPYESCINALDNIPRGKDALSYDKARVEVLAQFEHAVCESLRAEVERLKSERDEVTATLDELEGVEEERAALGAEAARLKDELERCRRLAMEDRKDGNELEVRATRDRRELVRERDTLGDQLREARAEVERLQASRDGLQAEVETLRANETWWEAWQRRAQAAHPHCAALDDQQGDCRCGADNEQLCEALRNVLDVVATYSFATSEHLPESRLGVALERARAALAGHALKEDK